jgi:hypothetical protein
MAKKTPTLRDKRIIFWDEFTGDKMMELDITVPRDHQAFLEMLETYKSFRFVGSDGTSCSVVKELRPQFGDKENLKPIWYAHRRLGGKLRRRYIGKPENLTLKKLKAVAFELSQRELI